MSALSYALSQLYTVLDRSLLEQAFLKGSEAVRNCPVANLDTLILDKVFYQRVFMDMNLMGGREIHLCSSHGQVIHQDAYGTAYHYADQGLHGHVIISALAFFPGLTCLSGMVGNSSCGMAGMGFPPSLMGLTQGTNVLGNALKQINNVNVGGPRAIPTPRIVAHNTILVDMLPMVQPMGMFKVLVSHDQALNDLNPKTWPAFARLFIAAVKSYIFQTLRSKILRGSTYYGQEFAIYSDMVNSFMDAEAEYQQQLLIWGKVARMNDKPRHNALIKLQTRPF